MGKIHKNSNKLNLAYPETAARVRVVAKSAKRVQDYRIAQDLCGCYGLCGG